MLLTAAGEVSSWFRAQPVEQPPLESLETIFVLAALTMPALLLLTRPPRWSIYAGVKAASPVTVLSATVVMVTHISLVGGATAAALRRL